MTDVAPDLESIIVEEEQEAKDVMTDLRKKIAIYGFAAVSDLYDLLGITGSFKDTRWGWRNTLEFANSRIEKVEDGFKINLPRPEHLNPLMHAPKEYEDASSKSNAVTFDSSNPNWTNNREQNLMFLRMIQTFLSQRLLVRGHVMLNDVYDSLGCPRTSNGCVLGWFKEEGSNNISFVVSETGTDNVFYLDFNVDGEVWKKLG